MEFNAVVSFIGVNGIGLEIGPTAYDIDEALVKKTMMARSAERILLADSSKFGPTYPASFAGFADFDRVVTNVDADPALVEAFSAAGVEVALA
jgi:DeoR/GlpR family transcriptional regulator of sugar metabolism